MQIIRTVTRELHLLVQPVKNAHRSLNADVFLLTFILHICYMCTPPSKRTAFTFIITQTMQQAGGKKRNFNLLV